MALKEQEKIEFGDYIITISTDEANRMHDVKDDELYWSVEFHVERKFPRCDGEFLFDGFIRNDGCSNWNWDDCTHFCDAEEAKGVGEVLAECYRQARYYTRDR
jgi:hypothetical protein